MARDCKAVVAATTRGDPVSHGKHAANGKARGRAYALGRGEPNQDSNTVTGMFLLYNRYASMLFDSSVDRSFVSTTFSSLIDIALTTLDYSYVVESADVYDEKVVRIPYDNKVLMIHGDGSDERSKSKLSIILCTKTQKYIQKGCCVFLAQITEKKAKDKSEEKRLEDVPVIRDFPEDFPGLSPTSRVEFLIELVSGAVPIA
ncbi:hypothetical protein Tco_1305628 [Tanacetum coccineum]